MEFVFLFIRTFPSRVLLACGFLLTSSYLWFFACEFLLERASSFVHLSANKAVIRSNYTGVRKHPLPRQLPWGLPYIFLPWLLRQEHWLPAPSFTNANWVNYITVNYIITQGCKYLSLDNRCDKLTGCISLAHRSTYTTSDYQSETAAPHSSTSILSSCQ